MNNNRKCCEGQGTTPRSFGDYGNAVYSGGGGAVRSSGGSGGGGNGSYSSYDSNVAGSPGTNGTGGGGGGGTSSSLHSKGGDGIVIIRWGHVG